MTCLGDFTLSMEVEFHGEAKTIMIIIEVRTYHVCFNPFHHNRFPRMFGGGGFGTFRRTNANGEGRYYESDVIHIPILAFILRSKCQKSHNMGRAQLERFHITKESPQYT